MEVLGKVWEVAKANWVLILVAVLVIGGVVAFVWWRKKHPPKRPPAAAEPKAMAPNRLLQVRQRFLDGIELVKRAAVRELPSVVVLGPHRAGKTVLIQLDADYEAQSRQFLPSYEEDELLKLYVGPNMVVQEMSAKLLEDDSPEARRALQRLWKECFERNQKGLAVIVLRVDWLVETEPDERKRITDLLRGKLNLISEACRVPVETRICVTHLDTLEGFTEFAKLMHEHGGSLTFELPRPTSSQVDVDELKRLKGQLVHLLESQENYLSLGLTTLPVENFGRLERFFSASGKSFEALADFVSELHEGNSLTLKLELTSLYLSFKPSDSTAHTRPVGALSLSTTEQQARAQRKRYLRKHLRHCAVIAAVCCLPVLAAHGNFYLRLRNAEQHMKKFRDTVHALPAHQDAAILKEQVFEAGHKINELWRARRLWPPLESSHPQRVDALQEELATGIRTSHLKPALEKCGKALHACRPEQVVHLLAILYSSRSPELHKLTIRASHSKHAWEWAPEGVTNPIGDQPATWVTALGLNETLVEDYAISSKTRWEPLSTDDWARWPFRRPLPPDSQLEPWLAHLQKLKKIMEARSLNDLAQLEELRLEHQALRKMLDDTALFVDSFKQVRPYVEQVLKIEPAGTHPPTGSELDTVQQTLDWVHENRQVLMAVLRMEEDAYQGWKAVRNLSTAAKLSRDGLWDASTNDDLILVPAPAQLPLPVTPQPAEGAPQPTLQAPQPTPQAPQPMPEAQPTPSSPPSELLSVKVQQNLFNFDPQEHSRALMRMIIEAEMKANPGVPGDSDGKSAEQRLSELHSVFYTTHKPLVDEFTRLMRSSQLPPPEAQQREAHVRQQMDAFALSYRDALFNRVSAYDFKQPTAATPSIARRELVTQMEDLTQPSSKLVDMLRDVSTRSNLEPMEGAQYEPVRNAVAPFQPIIQLMSQDKGGNYAALDAYRLLLARFLDELNATKAPGAKGDKAATAAAGDKADGDDKAAKGTGQATGDKAEPAESDGPPSLNEQLTPLGRLSLSMMLEEKGSYLREVDAWLDAQKLFGTLRVPFRKPFEVARDMGKQEIQELLQREWAEVNLHKLRPLLERYPFRPEALEEVEPSQLEALRRKDGSFWQFVDRTIAPLCEERGTQWALRGPLRGQLTLPRRMLTTLSRVSELSYVLWDAEGKPRPLMLQVMPQPLPSSPLPGRFITMATLKCGKTTASSYNQAPSWQDFPVTWWSQPTASLSLEQRSPRQEEPQYSSLGKNTSWSCFRLLESATAVSADQLRTWRLRKRDDETARRGQRGQEVARQEVDINFRVRGEPWAPFREVVR